MDVRQHDLRDDLVRLTGMVGFYQNKNFYIFAEGQIDGYNVKKIELYVSFKSSTNKNSTQVCSAFIDQAKPFFEVDKKDIAFRRIASNSILVRYKEDFQGENEVQEFILPVTEAPNQESNGVKAEGSNVEQKKSIEEICESLNLRTLKGATGHGDSIYYKIQSTGNGFRSLSFVGSGRHSTEIIKLKNELMEKLMEKVKEAGYEVFPPPNKMIFTFKYRRIGGWNEEDDFFEEAPVVTPIVEPLVEKIEAIENPNHEVVPAASNAEPKEFSPEQTNEEVKKIRKLFKETGFKSYNPSKKDQLSYALNFGNLKEKGFINASIWGANIHEKQAKLELILGTLEKASYQVKRPEPGTVSFKIILSNELFLKRKKRSQPKEKFQEEKTTPATESSIQTAKNTTENQSNGESVDRLLSMFTPEIWQMVLDNVPEEELLTKAERMLNGSKEKEDFDFVQKNYLLIRRDHPMATAIMTIKPGDLFEIKDIKQLAENR